MYAYNNVFETMFFFILCTVFVSCKIEQVKLQYTEIGIKQNFPSVCTYLSCIGKFLFNCFSFKLVPLVIKRRPLNKMHPKNPTNKLSEVMR